MNQILKKEDLINKTILKTGYTDNTFALFFTDETFAIFRGCGWDGHDVELMDESFSLEPTTYNAYELKEMGVITQKQLEKVWRDYNVKQKISQEKKDREQYEKLKSKYDKKTIHKTDN